MNTEWLNLFSESDNKITKAVAQARAAQIVAAMLGVVCHPEYYKSGQDQTVALVFA